MYKDKHAQERYHMDFKEITIYLSRWSHYIGTADDRHYAVSLFTKSSGEVMNVNQVKITLCEKMKGK